MSQISMIFFFENNGFFLKNSKFKIARIIYKVQVGYENIYMHV
jgi:hypothetical protein